MTLDPLHSIAEKRIQEALDAGEFRDLAGAGKPLSLDDLAGVPEELRAGYSVLKGAGMLPEEMELKRAVANLDELIAACADDGELRELRRKRDATALRFSMLMERRGFNPALSEYAERLAEKLSPGS
jgi:hypothetical protein